MAEEDSFDLSKFLTDSLSLQANAAVPTRMMFPSTLKDPYLKMFEEDPLEVLGEKNFSQPRKTSEDIAGTPIQEFFRNTNVFITGGTGFIGKILTEKLIRSMPHLEHIYLLIRAKRGKNTQERFQQLLEDQVFLRMKTEVPEYGSKITAVVGDISKPDLGLSAADRQLLLDRVHVVFHSAADVRFIEPLRLSIASNVLGSKRVLDLAKEMKKLKSYVHVSTAFSQCVKRIVKETVPEMSIPYQEILNDIESKTDEQLQDELTRIMQGWPNTYTFSKAICESMLQNEGAGLPLCIFRPSVVVPTQKEPVRGWTDNIYGPGGLMLGVGLGVLHYFRMNAELSTDFVPVDYVVNCMIATAWRTGIWRDHDAMPVYNFTSTPIKQVCWKSLCACGEKYLDCWPLQEAIWYPTFFFTDSCVVDELANIFLHKIPGKMFDTIAILGGQKPRLSKAYQRIHTLKSILDYFTSRTWEFKNDNVMKLWDILSKEDKEKFYFDLRDIDEYEHFLICKLGVRYYFLKEKMESIPDAKRKARWLYWIHNSLKMVSGLVVLKMLVCVAHVLPI